jgi:hypothetical protein
MPERPSIYICLLCGWQGQPRELARDPEGTRLFCPGCKQPASFLMDLSEPPEEFLARREELKLKATPELRGILWKFRKVLEADA